MPQSRMLPTGLADAVSGSSDAELIGLSARDVQFISAARRAQLALKLFRQGKGEIIFPPISEVIVLPDLRATAIKFNKWDLPQGISLERLADLRVAHEMMTLLDGQRVVISNTTDLFYIVGWDKLRIKTLPSLALLSKAETPRYGPFVIGLGVTQHGEVWRKLQELMHIMVAGVTGWGKTSFLRLLVYQLLVGKGNIELWVGGYVGSTLATFEDNPRVKGPIAYRVRDLAKQAETMEAEVERRKTLFRSAFQATGWLPDDLGEYNDLAEKHENVISLPHIMWVIDEFSSFMKLGGSDLQNLLCTLAMRCRKYGVTMLWAGHDWKYTTLDTLIRRQFLSAFAFKTGDRTDSKVVLGRSGAEGIATKGRCLYATRGGPSVKMQAFFVPKDVLGQHMERRGAVLPQEQVLLVRWAVERYGGKFPLRALAEDMDGQDGRPHFSLYRLQLLAKEWESVGWLVSGGPTRADGRLVTDELKVLAGCEMMEQG